MHVLDSLASVRHADVPAHGSALASFCLQQQQEDIEKRSGDSVKRSKEGLAQGGGAREGGREGRGRVDLWGTPCHSAQGQGVNLKVRQQHHVTLELSVWAAACRCHLLFFRHCRGRWRWGSAWLQAHHSHTAIPEAYLCRHTSHVCSLASIT